MPKLMETQQEKIQRLTRRFGYHKCQICQNEFPAFDINSGYSIGKTSYLKSRFQIRIDTLNVTFNDVCFSCCELMTNELADFIKAKWIKEKK